MGSSARRSGGFELVNKGTAFTRAERDALGLRGLLPPAVETLERQAIRALLQFNNLPGDIEKFNFLSRLKQQSAELFYHLLLHNMEQMTPIVYTPTVGKACQLYGQMFRATEGMYFCRDDRGHMRAMLDNWARDVAIVVVTDGSRVLGLGDLGTNGMGIPVGKLSLYVAAGGFDPQRTLPVVVDSGTDNQRLLDDPLYLGSRHPRLPDAEYYALMHEFLLALRDKWPHAIVQMEDISNAHCFELLAKYRTRLHCFNDDIQGTGAVIAAGFTSACRLAQTPLEKQRVLFLGAGSAAVGVAEQLVRNMSAATGRSAAQCREALYLVDVHGLVTTDRAQQPNARAQPFARADVTYDADAHGSLAAVVRALRPTALIGLSGSGGAFTRDVLTTMGTLNARPIVFALSNPTAHSECSAEDAYRATDGRAIFASGSPFGPVTLDDGRTLFPGQGNNMYIFPGLGFGAWLARSPITDGMVTRASLELVKQTTGEDLERGRVYPALRHIRALSQAIATAVMEQAFDEGVATIERPAGALVDYVRKHVWTPAYPVYTKE